MSETFGEPKRRDWKRFFNMSHPTISRRVPERRRAPRSKTCVPVFVYGHDPSQAPFHEDAYSAVISEQGALLIMITDVAVGQKLLLINKITQAEQECSVVGVRKPGGPNIEISIKFGAPAADFWRLMAPPQAASVLSVEPEKKAL